MNIVYLLFLIFAWSQFQVQYDPRGDAIGAAAAAGGADDGGAGCGAAGGGVARAVAGAAGRCGRVPARAPRRPGAPARRRLHAHPYTVSFRNCG